MYRDAEDGVAKTLRRTDFLRVSPDGRIWNCLSHSTYTVFCSDNTRHAYILMPVCTVCAYPADYLYTTYKTKSNIRLGVCVSDLSSRTRLTVQAKCGEFLDPLIEHPPLLLLLDLILLKPRIYLHLLFNRGSRPYDVDCEAPAARRKQERTDRLTSDFTNLALATLAAETATRLQARSTFTTSDAGDFVKMLGIVLLELTVQHVVTTILALAVLRWKGWYPKRNSGGRGNHDGRQDYFS